MEVAKVACNKFRCPRRMTMTPSKQKANIKNTIISVAREHSRIFSPKIVNPQLCLKNSVNYLYRY